MVNQCKEVNLNGTGWRLPTIRELMLIYLLLDELRLVILPGFQSLTEGQRYWSATEESADRAATVFLRDHKVVALQKSGGEGNSRCIRDL